VEEMPPLGHCPEHSTCALSIDWLLNSESGCKPEIATWARKAEGTCHTAACRAAFSARLCPSGRNAPHLDTAPSTQRAHCQSIGSVTVCPGVNPKSPPRHGKPRTPATQPLAGPLFPTACVQVEEMPPTWTRPRALNVRTVNQLAPKRCFQV
jgi:hypothetical protein